MTNESVTVLFLFLVIYDTILKGIIMNIASKRRKIELFILTILFLVCDDGPSCFKSQLDLYEQSLTIDRI
jgi:hypothetical protein